MIKRVIKYAIPLLVFLLPACSQEEEPGAALRPMEFSVSISDPPHSRVSETADGMGSEWTDGDIVILNVTQGGNTTTASSIIKNGELTDITPKLFWDASGEATVTAYFSNVEDKGNNPKNSVKFADQSNGLAYMLRASKTFKNGSTVNLTFTHQLAKVRVVVTGDKVSDINAVSVYNYRSYSVDDTGAVTGSNPGYIKMCKNGNVFEANVVPADEIPDNFISFGDDFEVSVSGITSLEAGKVYTITIDAKNPGPEAVLMRNASGTPGTDGYVPALYIADRNIGAETPEDVGLYFWWGDTQGWNDNFDFSSSNQSIITYNKSLADLASILTADGVLSEKYDAAHRLLGKGWRMMTKDDIEWLTAEDENENFKNCEFKTKEENGWVVGITVKSCETLNEVYFPFTGYFSGDKIGNQSRGYYWSSTPAANDIHAYYLYFSHSGSTIRSYSSSDPRYYGRPIRAVLDVE